MRKILSLTLTLVAFLAWTSASSAVELFRADLVQGEEPPHPDPDLGTGSSATGTALFTLNDAQDSLSYTIDLFGLDFNGQFTPGNTNDDLSGLHIHAGPTGVNAGVVFGMHSPQHDLDDRVISFPDPMHIRVTGAWDGTEGNGPTNMLSAHLTNLRTQGLYINAHTFMHTGGEIRGQIVPEPSSIVLGILGAAGLIGLAWKRRRAAR
jgi:hypothetical protein